jgi:hypothetical protein
MHAHRLSRCAPRGCNHLHHAFHALAVKLALEGWLGWFVTGWMLASSSLSLLLEFVCPLCVIVPQVDAHLRGGSGNEGGVPLTSKKAVLLPAHPTHPTCGNGQLPPTHP